MPRGVFLSHSSGDNPFCDRLALDLADYDVDVWYDEWEIKIGDSLRNKIAAGIDSNDYLAVVLSTASVESQWVQQELNAALAKELKQRHVFVLPLLIEECKIPVFLQDKKWADFRTDYDHGLKQLLERLEVKKRTKRRRRTPAQQSQGGRHRNDELALPPEEFQQWFLDRLEEGNHIRIQRYLWNWRGAVRAFVGQPFPDEIPSKQLDLDDSSQAILDRVVICGTVLARYGEVSWLSRIAELLYDAYLGVNELGLQGRASVDMNVQASAARLRVIDAIFAIGASLMAEQRYSSLADFLGHTTPDQGYWEKRSWFRYALTMAARGDPQKNADWYLPVGRVVNYITARPGLRQYFRSQDEILAGACQFDLMQALYWVLRSEDGDLWDSYPTCATYAPRMVEPLITKIIMRQEPASLLGDFSDQRFADVLRGFAEIVRGRGFFRASGWSEDGWGDAVVQGFLAAHPPSSPSATA